VTSPGPQIGDEDIITHLLLGFARGFSRDVPALTDFVDSYKDGFFQETTISRTHANQLTLAILGWLGV
jgi:hypothetical protein